MLYIMQNNVYSLFTWYFIIKVLGYFKKIGLEFILLSFFPLNYLTFPFLSLSLPRTIRRYSMANFFLFNSYLTFWARDVGTWQACRNKSFSALECHTLDLKKALDLRLKISETRKEGLKGEIFFYLCCPQTYALS